MTHYRWLRAMGGSGALGIAVEERHVFVLPPAAVPQHRPDRRGVGRDQRRPTRYPPVVSVSGSGMR